MWDDIQDTSKATTQVYGHKNQVTTIGLALLSCFAELRPSSTHFPTAYMLVTTQTPSN